MEKIMEKGTTWSMGRKVLAVVMALLLAVPVNSGSPMSGVAEAAESREIVSADGWTLTAKWAKSAAASNLAWESDKDETKVVRLEIGYSREGVDKAYAPGELAITVPGIGDAVRGKVAQATDVAADPQGSRELSYDWSYTWDEKSDTYTFTNNNQIDAGEAVSGSFEVLWALKSRETVNLYEKTLFAEMESAGETIASTSDVKFSYKSVKDPYAASLSTAALGSSDGLGADYRDYIWVKYRVQSTRSLKSCGMTDARWEIALPEGAKVADVRNANDSAMAHTVNNGVLTVPMKPNLSNWYSSHQPQITVGFPRETYNGAETVVTAKLIGTYADYTQPEVAAQYESRFTMNADDYDFSYNGSSFWVDKARASDSRIIHGSLFSDAGADYTYRISALARCSEGDNAKFEVIDDFHDALLNNGQMRQLGDGEYSYKSVTIPSASNWKNGNGQAAEAGKYTAVVLADTGSGFTEVRSVAVNGASYEVSLPAGTVRVKVVVDGVNSVLSLSNLNVTVSYHPVQEGGMYDPGSIAPEGSIRSTVGLVVSKGGEIANAVGRDSYTGTYADVVADRDMATYGAYVQRSWNDAPIAPSGHWQSYTEVVEAGYSVDSDGYHNKLTVSSRTVNEAGEKPWAEKVVQALLLPIGMHADLESQEAAFSAGSCSLESGSSLTSGYIANHASIDVERNWKGSGRELVRVSYDFSGDRLNMAPYSRIAACVPVYIPVEEYMEYGDAYRATAATLFDAAADNQSGYYGTGADDGSWAGADKELLADIDQDGDISEIVTYDYESTAVILASATYQSSKETVRTVRTDGGFVADSYVTEGEEYAWKMQLITGTTEAVDVELVDMFDEPGFKGEFTGVDVTYLENRGYSPVVSYTADGATWTDKAAWNRPLTDVAGVKVALPGQTVPSGSLVYALVNMTAPEDKMLVGSETENGYSATFNAVDSNTGREIGPVAIESAPATLRFLDQVGTIEITKTDAASGRKLAGATFDVIASDGTKVAEGVATNRLGKIEVKEVPFGEYAIVETKAPSGYETASSATVDHNQEKTAVSVADERAKATALLQKRDASTGGAVEGAVFELAKLSGGFWLAVEGGTYTTDAEGRILIENLDWGSYRLTETACEGYELMPRPVSFTVDASNAKGAAEPIAVGGVLGVTNQQMPSVVTVVKTGVDENGRDTRIPVDGAEYGLYDEHGAKIASDWTDENGRIEFRNVLHGKYYVKEITAAKGYAIDAEEHRIEITRKNAGEGVGMRLTDTQKGATLTIIKADAAGHQRLEGAEFDVRRADGALVGHVTTDDLGEARLRELPWGDYTVTETRAPKGFVLDEKPRNVTVGRDNADMGIEIRFDDERKQGSVVLVKSDEETGAKLADAEYDLYKTDGTLARGDLPASDANGEIAVDGLEWGSYYFKEKTAPAGYSLSDAHVRFAVNASTVDMVQTVEAFDRAGEAAITIEKTVSAADYVAAQGEPSFMFKVERTDAAGSVKWAQIKFDEASMNNKMGDVTLSATVGGLAAGGTYTVTEIDSMRYENTGDATVTVDLAAGEGRANFENEKVISQERSVYSDTDSVLNIVKSGAKITAMTAEWTGGVVTETALDPENLDVTLVYDDGTTRRLGADEYALDPAKLPGGVNGEYIVRVKTEQGGKTFAADVVLQLDTPKMLKDYTAAELQAIADDLAANEMESEYWAEFNMYLQTDDKWYFTLADGTRMEFRIVGINHDNRSWAREDRGDAAKAGITMQAVGLLPKTYRMNETDSNTDGWRASALRASMNEASGEINQLFADLLPYVASVDKMTKNTTGGYASTVQAKTPTATADKLWVMSQGEMYSTTDTYLGREGERYEWYKLAGVGACTTSSAALVKCGSATPNTASPWWTRSIAPSVSTSYMNVMAGGKGSDYHSASSALGVCPAFCFGTSYEAPPEYWIDVPADNPEAQKLGVAGTTLLPADIVRAANDIATNKDESQYYAMYHSFMENEVFMKVRWGDGQQYDVRIVGFNHDDVTGGAGKAGITWQFVELLNKFYPMNGTASNDGGWRDSALRANMNEGAIWRQVPDTLKADIVTVDKLTRNRDDGTATNAELLKVPVTSTKDKLWVMSYAEVVETCSKDRRGLEGEGAQYEYWNGKVTRNDSYNDCLRKTRPIQPGIFWKWWERSVYVGEVVYSTSLTHFGAVEGSGYPGGSEKANSSTGICPCFCMGEPEPEFWIEKEDGSIMKPAEIKAAANSISELGEASPYWTQFRSYMEYGGEEVGGATFGQALEDGYGLMHIKWGDGREYTARIVGMNHDDKSDGSGKAGLTFQFTGLLYDYQRFNPTSSNEGGWKSSELRFRMNPAELGDESALMENAKSDHGVWDNVPGQLQGAVETVDKMTKNMEGGDGSAVKAAAPTATKDKLWIMAQGEMYATTDSYLGQEGDRYEWYELAGVGDCGSATPALVKCLPPKQWEASAGRGGPGSCWERSVSPAFWTSFITAGSDGGGSYSYNAGWACGVCPCFCL